MTPASERRLDELTGRHLDGALDEAGVAELAALLEADGAARSAFARAIAYDTALPRVVRRPELTLRPTLRRWWPVLVAAATLVVGLGLWLLPVEDRPRLEAGAQATVLRAGVELDAVAAGRLRRDDRVQASGPAVLRWGDEATQVDLAAGTVLDVAAPGPAKELVLARGRIAVTAASQRGGRSLFVRTDRLELAVVGTRFSVSTGAAGSAVEVAEGTVAVSTGGAGRQLVAAGNLAMIAPAGALRVMPAAIVSGGATLVRLDAAAWISARGAGWTGRAVADGIAGEVVTETAERVANPLRDDGHARLRPDLAIHLDATLGRPGTLAVFLVCARADGTGWLGNYSVRIDVPAGRHQRTWTLTDLQVEKGAALDLALGARITSVAVGAWNQPVGLVVHACTVGAPSP